MASATPFGMLLRAHLRDRFGREQDFARAVGITHATLSQIINGVRPMPENRIAEFAAAFQLEGAALERFRVEAWLTQAPEALGEWVRNRVGWTEPAS